VSNLKLDAEARVEMWWDVRELLDCDVIKEAAIAGDREALRSALLDIVYEDLGNIQGAEVTVEVDASGPHRNLHGMDFVIEDLLEMAKSEREEVSRETR